MKSAWKVTSNRVGMRTLYGVYRIGDTNEVDHSGNREMCGDYVEDKSEAAYLAKKLNDAESKEV